MAEIELAAGTIDYSDTGGTGPCLVLLHGPLMDGTVWRKLVAELEPDYRCVVPTLPFGAHRRPMRPDADLSIGALADLVAEFLERLGLTDVTLVVNDWGGAQLIVERGRADRVGRLVLAACEAFDNFPPGPPGRMLGRLSRIPGGLGLLALLSRSAAVRARSIGAMAKYAVPDPVLRGWLERLGEPAIRRDLRKYVISVPLDGNRDWSAGLAGFDRPALVVWAPEDAMMPPEHGRRLAELLPQGRLVEVADSFTLIQQDQPAVLARHLRDFVPG
ncbi:alpha/beta fold hydrolase [Microlunatus speluncae]|uniref:alpha/beta fold hydrolase n=1 Tax=Microlunatus speluncae TaxID=2594267 RepID=UPI00126682D0|nr:alpha/beta hydrolase [Microlunatus speluncae]